MTTSSQGMRSQLQGQPGTFKALCCSLMDRLSISLSCFEKLERSHTKWLAEATQLSTAIREEKAMKERFRQVNREQAKILSKMESRIDELERQLKKAKDLNEVIIKEKQMLMIRLKEKQADKKDESKPGLIKKVNQVTIVCNSKDRAGRQPKRVSVGTQTK